MRGWKLLELPEIPGDSGKTDEGPIASHQEAATLVTFYFDEIDSLDSLLVIVPKAMRTNVYLSLEACSTFGSLLFP